MDAAVLLDWVVRLGLAATIAGIADQEPALRLACADGAAAASEAGLERLDWRAQRKRLSEAWARATGGLHRFAEAAKLSLADMFAAALPACCERRRSTALAVAALQAPAPGSRPSVHLTLELKQVLFDGGPGDAMELASGALVEQGLLSLAGEDALPQRLLAVRLPLWRALSGGPAAWPGCRGLPAQASPAPLAGAALAIAEGAAAGLLLRGPPGSGRAAAAAALASRLKLIPIEAPLGIYRDDRGFATACRILGWLPVLRIPSGEEATLDGACAGLPVTVLAGPHDAVHGDRLLEMPLSPPPHTERLRIWQAALGEQFQNLDGGLLAAAMLYPAAIAAVAHAARLQANAERRAVTAADVAAARQATAPAGLSELAHPVRRHVDDSALVAGPRLRDELAALIARCRRRETVWQGLGPSLAAGATRGVRVLFAGESGTGKTLAASHVATALGAPLYRCDLAAVMNKYIGETEKNLGHLLDHAEAADVVLLFDEADALFGRRSEGTETGERYANMLTNYLLTRLEAHHGIVILTANTKARIDPAFWRRLDDVIDFPMPGYEERLALWHSHLGSRAPPQPVLERLASYCDLAGGGIRNAVLAAASLAPEQGSIEMEFLTPALRREYAKLRRTLPAGLAMAVRTGS
jgi:DNA polymerase III delta prime subunit